MTRTRVIEAPAGAIGGERGDMVVQLLICFCSLLVLALHVCVREGEGTLWCCLSVAKDFYFYFFYALLTESRGTRGTEATRLSRQIRPKI